MTLHQIDSRMSELVKTERSTTREILELIRKAEAIKLPEQLGYRDTYQWLIQKHSYSGSAAHRRIQAARLLRDLPEVAKKVETGALNLSSLCKMQSVLKAQHKATGERASVEIKREAMLQIENKTYSEVEKQLHSLFPEADVSQEKTTQKRDGSELRTIQFSTEGVRLLDRARELLSHAMPGAKDGELLERVLKDFVSRHDPLLKAERRNKKAELKKQETLESLGDVHDKNHANDHTHIHNKTRPHNETQIKENKSHDGQIDKNSPQRGTDDRFCAVAGVSTMKNERTPNLQCKVKPIHKSTRMVSITPAIRQKVILQAQGQCEYTYNNQRCTSRYQLEIDHIIPRAKGGSNDFTNLRCLCRRHNQMRAELEFGPSFMQAKRRESRTRVRSYTS